MLDFLFGKKRKCDRRKKSCRRPKKYNVAGSVCNKLKRKTCKSTNGCSYVKRRGCRRSKGFAKLIISGAVPEVNNQITAAATAGAAAAADTGAPIADQAIAAAAAAADTAAANVEAVGGTVAQAHNAAIMAGQEAAQEVVMASGASPEQVQETVNRVSRIIDSAQGMGSLAAQAAAGRGRLRATPTRNPAQQRPVNPFAAAAAARAREMGVATEFGRRKSRFGASVCSTLLPKNISTCLNYRDSNGLFPCNWSGGANARCQLRSGSPVPYAIASTVGKYMTYVIAITPSLAAMVPPPLTELPVAATMPTNLRGKYDCVGKNINECGSNPNCNWQSGAKPPRCVRQRGHLEGTQYEGPMGKSSGYTPPDDEFDALMSGLYSFGKKRKSRKGRSKKNKLSAKIRRLCRKFKIKTTKKVGNRRVYKSIKVLKKQIAKKMKKVRRTKKR